MSVELAAAREQLATASSKASRLEADATAAAAKLQSLQRSHDECAASLAARNSDVTSLTAHVHELEQSVAAGSAAASTATSAHAAECAAKDDTIASLESRVAALQSSLRDAESAH